MGDASRVGEARRHAALLAGRAGLDEEDAGRVALIVTELGTNLLRHATQGRLLLAVHEGSRMVEAIAIDAGPLNRLCGRFGEYLVVGQQRCRVSSVTPLTKETYDAWRSGELKPPRPEAK